MAQIKPLTGADLLSVRLAPQREWLPPLIKAGSLGMIYAKPGVGKSYFCLWLAASVAGGEPFLKWPAFEAARVLYVDGEMGLSELKARYAELCEHHSSEMQKLQTTFLTVESFPSLIPQFINEQAGQKFYGGMAHQADVIILDNYCSLTKPNRNESDAQTWANVQPWLTQLRAFGKCVILVHHAGKSGDQLGTSTKEFALDWCLNFYKPADYEDEQGARFNIRFTKGRFKGEEKEGFSAWYQNIDGETRWTWQAAKEARRAQVREMKAVGMNDHDIASALGVSVFTVKKTLRQLEAEAEQPPPPVWEPEEMADDRLF